MKKIISGFLFIIFVSYTLLLAGCDLVTLNEEKYSSEVLMQVGEVDVTRRDFTLILNDIISRHRENEMDRTIEEAVEETKDVIITRELIIQYTKDKYGELNQYYLNKTWEEVYKSINDSLSEIEKDIMEEWEIEFPEKPEDQDFEPDFEPFEPFEPEVEMIDGSIVRIKETKDYNVDPIGDFKVRNNNRGLDSSVYKDIQNEAWDRYIRELIRNEKGRNLSTVPEEVFLRRKDFLYNIIESNTYINLFEDYYSLNQDLDHDLVLRKYKELVRRDYEKYSLDIEKYHEDIKEDASDVYYHPSNAPSQYAMVSHVLISFSDEQEAKLEQLDKDLENGKIKQEVYEYQKDKIIANLSARARDDKGFEYGERLAAEDILNEINNTVNGAGDGATERAEAFNEFIYKYNQDPGMFNSEAPYFVNLNDNVENIMVDEFTQEVRRLHNEEFKGAVSGLVLSEFGYHIIMYHDTPSNIAKYEDLDSVNIYDLYNRRMHPALENNMYQHISADLNHYPPLTDYRNAIEAHMRGILEIKIFEDKIEDTIS